MSKRSKRYRALKEKVDSTKTYNLDEAMGMLSSGDSTKFSTAVELHVRTGIDVKQSDQAVRGTVVLPHGSGKTQRILALTNNAKEAEAAGAVRAGGEEIINDLKSGGKIDFDVLVAEPAFMPKLAPVAKILGPKGLMPSPKDGTVTPDVVKAIKDLVKGKISFKNDDTGNVHMIVGRVAFGPEKIKENIQAAFEAIKTARPTTIKGTFIKAITLCTTMGPGIKVTL
ncbi:MAG: 50S ribosomal protein L1 [Candidatus Komeilibacteria bacterium]|nr:50S ribosomal protein L1 [Candidatus Komeilibacteria bacterium]